MRMITVAIPTLARREYALDALRSVAAQVCNTPFEVLVVDNGCDSCLAESVRQVARTSGVPVVYVPVSAVGLHNARHEAARQAHGDVLAYLDDDVVVEPGWLAGVAGSFSDPTVHLVGGRCLPLYETDPPPWLEAFSTRNDDGTWWCGYLTLIDLGPDSKDIDPRFVFGANFAIRKETLVRVGGFHPDGLPWHLRRFRGDGETAVSIAVQKLGLRAVYSPEAAVLHRVPGERTTMEYLERRAFLQGVSSSFSAERYAVGGVAPEPRPSLQRRMYSRFAALAARRTNRRLVTQDWLARRDTLKRAHAAGCAYHQEELQRDPAMRAWVSRPDFWEATVPDGVDGAAGIGGATGES